MFGKGGWLRRVASLADAAAAKQETPSPPIVRLARPEDYDRILDLGRDAFRHDPAFLYFVGAKDKEVTEGGLSEAKEAQLRSLLEVLLKSVLYLKGRITAVVDPSQDKILAAVLWLPPNKRVELQQFRLLLQSGILGIVKNWGLSTLLRTRIEWLDAAHTTFVEMYKRKGITKESADDSWFLLSAMIDPLSEHRGFMSLLMEDAFANGPNDSFTLVATTARLKDQYASFGYDLLSTYKVGEGKADCRGLPASGKEAVGVDCYAMVKWAPGLTLL
ncbi:hypothetical protein FA13DRAFT_118806 [Coprinellus micaceus]|uniref:N-acetyltransferase domain-containing protein n=1 Tax=Coprinellus micaceus TaxID=71717 RepID=A0A4Y7TIA0_COPMI|nr:hypothetical protein FA13DRAFT_118806 [Coprinellus micaceus]